MFVQKELVNKTDACLVQAMGVTGQTARKQWCNQDRIEYENAPANC